MKYRLLEILLATIATIGTPVFGSEFITINEGLVAYYPLDGDAEDYSGNKNHAVVGGSHTWEQDDLGKFIRFIGVPATYSSAGGHLRLPNFDQQLGNTFSFNFFLSDLIEHTREGESFIGWGDDNGQNCELLWKN